MYRWGGKSYGERTSTTIHIARQQQVIISSLPSHVCGWLCCVKTSTQHVLSFISSHIYTHTNAHSDYRYSIGEYMRDACWYIRATFSRGGGMRGQSRSSVNNARTVIERCTQVTLDRWMCVSGCAVSVCVICGFVGRALSRRVKSGNMCVSATVLVLFLNFRELSLEVKLDHLDSHTLYPTHTHTHTRLIYAYLCMVYRWLRDRDKCCNRY